MLSQCESTLVRNPNTMPATIAPLRPCQSPTGVDVEDIDAFVPFQEWVTALHSPDGLVGGEGATLGAITIRDVFRFGKRVGFLFLEADLSMPSLTGVGTRNAPPRTRTLQAINIDPHRLAHATSPSSVVDHV